MRVNILIEFLEIREQRVSADKASKVLGWRPAHSLDEGLARTVDWYRGYLGEDA